RLVSGDLGRDRHRTQRLPTGLGTRAFRSRSTLVVTIGAPTDTPRVPPPHPPRAGVTARSRGRSLGVVAALSVAVLIAIACTGGGASMSSTTPTFNARAAATEGYSEKTFSFPPDRPPASRPTAPPPPASLPPNVPIDHVIFIVKENRTFDHYFGKYPGADGTTVGKTLEGTTIRLTPAPDVTTTSI